jgi:hypothetical protein
VDAGLYAFRAVSLKLVSERDNDVKVNKVWVKLRRINCVPGKYSIAEILFYVSNHFCGD